MANTFLHLDASVAVDGDGSIGAPFKFAESANAVMINSNTLLVDRNTEVVLTTGFTNNSIGVTGARPRIASADKNLGWAEAPGAHISGPSSIVYGLDVFSFWDIVGLEISGVQNGIGTSNQPGLYMSGCYIHDCTTRGLLTAAQSEIENSTLSSCPIGIAGSNQATIRNNYFKNCPIALQSYYGSIEKNVFDTSSSYCISIGSNGNVIKDNVFYNSPIGIWDVDAARTANVIDGNAFESVTIAADLTTTQFTYTNNIELNVTTSYDGIPLNEYGNVTATVSPFVDAAGSDFSTAETSELRSVSTVVGSALYTNPTRDFVTAGLGPSQAGGGGGGSRSRFGEILGIKKGLY